ncbi:MAG: AMP-binding protein [Pseudomonadales bacterium]|nr:AMP-binding protein [Pseudomonadales bacterium]
MITLDDIRTEDEIVLGVAPARITDQLPRRLSDRVLEWCEKTPAMPALKSNGKTISYGEMGKLIAETREWLVARGVRPGDRVMIVGENGLALELIFLALSTMDGIGAVINARLSHREIGLIADDCDPRIVVFTTDDSADALAHSEEMGAEPVRLSFGDFRATRARETEPEVCSDDPVEQVLAMIYTTGTTGTPKGVMLTHRNLSFIAFISGRLRGIQAGDPVYCVLPMSHVFGLSAVSSSVLFCGGCVHLVSRFSASETLRAIEEDQLVGFLGVPTMYAMMLEALQGRENWQPRRPRFMFSRGAPLDPSLKQRVEARFGMPLHNGFGLTETGPTVCQTRLYAPLENCSVGFQLPGVDVEVRGADGKSVPQGDVGELWVRGPNVMKGYFRKPELTAEVIVDGWFNTGDLVNMDSAGAIHIAGRSKELIIRSGFNVYPPEVEAVLASHPDVSLCAVVGHRVGEDEEIVAFIQPVEGHQIDEQAIHDFARQSLAGYKVPNRLVIKQALPTAPSGKILKHQLASSL